MSISAQFTQIIGDAPVTLSDANRLWEKTFSTAGRVANGPAFLIFNVRHLTFATAPVVVSINNAAAGYIHPYPELNDADRNNGASHWHTQLIAVAGSQLNNGSNEIQVQAATFPNPGNPGNLFDDFEIKNCLCFYHQEG